MALLVSLTLPETTALVDGAVVVVPETTYPQAYARVLFARSFAAETYICAAWYADEAARHAGADPVKVAEYAVATTALKGDVFPAMYAHLKTMLDFAGAIDHPVVDPAEVIEPEPTPVAEPAPVTEPAVQPA